MKTNFKLLLIFTCFILIEGQLDSVINTILKETEQSYTITPTIGSSTTLSFDPTNSGNTETQITYNQTKFSLDPLFNTNNTYNNQCEHECVSFFQCNNGVVNTNGETIIDIRLNDGPCGNAFLTCCELQDQTTDRLSSSSSAPPISAGCGYRQPDGVGFKITGNKESEAQFAEFPWMVLIHNSNESFNYKRKASCGGALIHPQAVITAAHCVSNEKARLRVRAGEWDLSKTIEPYPYQEVEVESITIHKQYYSGALYNDIAFLYLKTPLTLSQIVNTICLPPPDYQHQITRCFTTGWGKDKFGSVGNYHVILKRVDLPVVAREECQSYLRKTRLGKFFVLHSSFMCAGGENGKDACNGDGGSPLVCPLDGEEWRYYQAGIVSWGIGCGDENVPGVYVDLAKFRTWIDEQMAIHMLETITYDQNVGLEPRF